ncbi:MAG: MMPL family transporter [Kofleriaceae bacterium]
MTTTASARATRYVAWIRRWSAAIVATAVVITALAVYLVAFHLPLRADFSNLLPPDAPAVRDLRRLEARVRTPDTVLVVVAAPDPISRAAAAAELGARIRAMPATLVSQLEDDDQAVRDFARAHLHLLVPLDDLVAARAALTERLAAAKRDANPLYINLDEEADADAAAAAQARLDELRGKRADAMRRLDKSRYVSDDELHQLLVVRTAFPKTAVDQGEQLLAALGAARAAVIAAHPGVDVGLTGGVVNSVAEHHALQRGMVVSSIITALLVGLVIALYFRSLRLLVILSGVLGAATVTSFGAAAFTVGHLNAATAFLGAIIAGNGVNYGILLIGAYLDLRRSLDADQAMAGAIAATTRPTLVASLGASIAYGSLAATSFRGFADFATIGAVGMFVCWAASYTVLPALVLLTPSPRLPAEGSLLGRILARLFGFRHPGRVLAVTGLAAIAAALISYRYVIDDPFEYDIRNLRSEGPDAILGRKWLAISDAQFGRGISGQTYIAADRPAQVPLIVEALRSAGPAGTHTIGVIHSILEVMPADQDARLAVLRELRELLADPAFDELTPDERAELDSLRPPADLRAITVADLPAAIADPLRERDGQVGLLIGVRPDPSVDEWNGHDLIRFANAVRRLELPDHETVTTSGPAVIFADIIEAIQSDGLLVTGTAALGLVVMVLVVVGRNRRAVAVLTGTGLGALGLIAVCALAGIKVNFLDFVALPITLGLGVDYAINIGHRHDGVVADATETLRTAGAGVFVCSLTTIIGYGSLLVSDNLAIRGFGLASLIGEITCLATALIVVPALLSWRRRAA